MSQRELLQDIAFARAEGEDLATAAEILRDAWASRAAARGLIESEKPGHPAFSTPERLAVYVEEHRAELYLLIVGDRALACGAYWPDGDDSRAAWVSRIAVRSEVQGRGYGKAMVRFLEDRIREQGFETARLEQRDLESFYGNMGYQIIGGEHSECCHGSDMEKRL